jgi:GNAT superfamily N-acetyltransferase
MLVELSPSELGPVLPLFQAPHLEYVINAMAAGMGPSARVRVSAASRPESALLWAGPRFYFAGRADDASFREAATRLIATQLSPPPGSYLVIHYDAPHWVETLSALFGGRPLRRAQRCLYRLDSQGIPGWRERVPDGFSIARMDRPLLSRTGLANLRAVIDEIESGWPALDLFLERGFGFCALRNGDEIAGWCTGEYASGRHIGVGIETVEKWQRRGLATLTASAFAEHCLSEGREAHWDCWADNLPSVRVAEKVGFVKVLDYDVHRG